MFSQLHSLGLLTIHITSTRRHSKSSNLRRIAVALSQTSDHELQTMSFLGYPKVITYTKFGQFGIIRFSVTCRMLV